MTKPKIGDIWRYPYLWKREADAGEEGGRKPTGGKKQPVTAL